MDRTERVATMPLEYTAEQLERIKAAVLKRLAAYPDECCEEAWEDRANLLAIDRALAALEGEEPEPSDCQLPDGGLCPYPCDPCDEEHPCPYRRTADPDPVEPGPGVAEAEEFYLGTISVDKAHYDQLRRDCEDLRKWLVRHPVWVGQEEGIDPPRIIKTWGGGE